MYIDYKVVNTYGCFLSLDNWIKQKNEKKSCVDMHATVQRSAFVHRCVWKIAERWRG